ncbi:MAG: hypothetical protein HXY50_16200 [Ignavibacteriaceae bacterium]|nr:hypothetical protein [Ignavibacteriaceae bacterium]
MSEMLANHYFLVRNFLPAKTLFEKILIKEDSNKNIKKKLIICCVITGEIKRALELFTSLIEEDIDVILNTDLNSEDCPCPELIGQIENHNNFFNSESEYLIGLGILWLYCDLHQSLKYFNKVLVLAPDNNQYLKITSILRKRLSEDNPDQYN